MYSSVDTDLHTRHNLFDDVVGLTEAGYRDMEIIKPYFGEVTVFQIQNSRRQPTTTIVNDRRDVCFIFLVLLTSVFVTISSTPRF